MTDLSHYEDADDATLQAALLEFDALLPPASVRVALDVGSRDAQIARGLARHYSSAHVWAFECNPAAVAVCRENLQNEARVTLIDKAVTDTDGPVTFYPIDPERTITPHADGNIGASSLYKANAAYPYETYAQNEVAVMGTTLQSWAAEAGVAEIDVLWMDLQGAELPALKGLGLLLAQVKIIHVEVQYQEMYVGAALFEDVDAFLAGQGFARVKKLYACEWFGDVVYVRHELLQPAAAPSVKTLVLEPQYGGLGDHLFFSHLPRIAKQFGGYDKVFISNAAPFRHQDYKRLIWDVNPYVDGFTDARGPAFDFAETDGDGNLLDYFMHLHGLEDGQRGHEPEVYFKPALIPELIGKTVYDPNFVSFVGEMDSAHVGQFFAQEGALPDFQMKARGDSSLVLSSVRGEIETPTIEDFCAVLFSCKALYCLASGTATLAAALGKPATVLHGRGQKPMFHHSPRHQYISLPPGAPGMPPPLSVTGSDDGKLSRERWLTEKANLVPIGSRVLSVGTASYEALFSHCDFYVHRDMANMTPIPAPDRSFDALVCTDVLEYMPEPVSALREMARLLRPGGTLLLLTSSGSKAEPSRNAFYRAFTSRWYETFCAECGLRVMKTVLQYGYLEAILPVPGEDWQEKIDRHPSDIYLYREAAWAAHVAGDTAAAQRFQEDLEELDPDAVFTFSRGLGK